MPTLNTKDREARKIQKKEKRQKQREQNLIRAKEMHNYRLKSEKNSLLEKPKKRVKIPKYNIGCSGWFYWHWKYSVYPEGLSTKEWFKYYSTKFKTVELNAPFYSWPTMKTVLSWNTQAGKKNFIYTVKVPELITQIKKFKHTKTLIRDFYTIENILLNRMGCFLFQFPPSFHYSKGALNRIISQLEADRRNVVEFRHASWWNEEVYEAFRQKNIIFCSSSSPKLPDKLIKTSDEIYIRFHGLKQWYKHDYTKEELLVWVNRIKKSKAKRVWAYFNNDRDGYAVKNARLLLRYLNAN